MRTIVFLLISGAAAIAEEKVDLPAIHRIKTEAFQHSKVMDHAFYLTDVYGPRLTGSPGLKAAAEWAGKRMGEWGLVNANLDKAGTFCRGWSQAKVSAHLQEPQYAPVIGVTRPRSPGTNGR